jgi:hypothetical protein
MSRRPKFYPPELLPLDNAMEDFWREYKRKTARAEVTALLAQRSGISYEYADLLIEDRLASRQITKRRVKLTGRDWFALAFVAALIICCFLGFMEGM